GITAIGTSAVQRCRGHSSIVGAAAYAETNQTKITSAVTEYTRRKPRSPNWSRSDPRKPVLDNRTWEPQKAPPAMISERSSGAMERPSHAPGRLAISADSLVISWCGSPATCTILLRLEAPAMIERSRRGKCQASARSCNNASLACPSRAGAVTKTFSGRPPSAAAPMPSRRSNFARGARRTATRMPSPIRIRGWSGKGFEHQIAQEIQHQDQDYRRNVDPAKVGKDGSDRAQYRLGNPPQKVAGRSDDSVVAVDHTEGEEPAEHCLGDQQPDINRDQS